jgi:hypothetical protein
MSNVQCKEFLSCFKRTPGEIVMSLTDLPTYLQQAKLRKLTVGGLQNDNKIKLNKKLKLGKMLKQISFYFLSSISFYSVEAFTFWTCEAHSQ